jgi:hypothetical protein
MFTNLFLQTASAEVKPGDMITYQNADKIHDLVSPGTLYKVKPGDEHENRPHLTTRLAAAVQGGDRKVLWASAPDGRPSKSGKGMWRVSHFR